MKFSNVPQNKLLETIMQLKSTAHVHDNMLIEDSEHGEAKPDWETIVALALSGNLSLIHI